MSWQKPPPMSFYKIYQILGCRRKLRTGSEKEVCQKGYGNKMLYGKGDNHKGYYTGIFFRKLDGVL